MKQHYTSYIHLSADMQPYLDYWKNLMVRPGGMHTLMSFLGCIGALMNGSGLEELLFNRGLCMVCALLEPTNRSKYQLPTSSSSPITSRSSLITHVMIIRFIYVQKGRETDYYICLEENDPLLLRCQSLELCQIHIVARIEYVYIPTRCYAGCIPAW